MLTRLDALVATALLLAIQTTPTSAQGRPHESAPVSATTMPRDSSATPDTVRNRPAVNECAAAHPEWLFCDDFETDRTARYFEYANPHGSFERVPGTGVLGSTAMRAHWEAHQMDAGSLKLGLGRTPAHYIRPVDTSGTAFRELYWRVYLRNDSTWTGGGGDKLSRALSLVSEHWAEGAGAPVWSGHGADANHLVLDPFSGVAPADSAVRTTTYNDFPRLRWLGAVRSVTPIFDQAHVGRWYCVEAHARLNDPGASNGVFELWIDDWLEARHDGLDWTGRFTGYGLDAVFFENYWNAGSPAAQSRYLDNIVVSTRRIGCGRIVGVPDADSASASPAR